MEQIVVEARASIRGKAYGEICGKTCRETRSEICSQTCTIAIAGIIYDGGIIVVVIISRRIGSTGSGVCLSGGP